MSTPDRLAAAKRACQLRAGLHRRAMSLELAMLSRPASLLDQGLTAARTLVSLLGLFGPGRKTDPAAKNGSRSG